MELVKSQYSSKEIIVKAYKNFKKAPKDRLTKLQYIQCRIDTLEDQWKLFLTTHRKLVLIATDELLEEEYFTEDVYDIIEEVYINYNSDLKELLDALTPSSSNYNNYVPKESSNECNIKLPKISIPVFSGNYSEWNTFRDLFISLVHQNTSIDNVQKMYYLKGLLSGEAEQLLRHVQISSASYLEAWAILNKRYNNKKYLCNCLLKRFMDQPSVGNESCTAIKELLDTTTDTLNGLKNLGIDVSSWDVIVVYIVSSKLDTESRKQWESHINSSEELPSITQLKDFLEMKFRSLEFLDVKQNSKPFFSNKPKVMHAIPNAQQVKPCPFCKKTDHKISRCTQFTDLEFIARVDFVQANGLCFNCLGLSHYVKDCRYPPNCQICKQRHNSLLHFKPSSEPPISDPKPEAAAGDGLVKSSKEQKDQPVVSHFSKKITPNQILLATALIEAQTKNSQVQLLRALLDQGSQASFITESAVQLLGLKRTSTKSTISGLGGDASALSSKYVVTMNIQSRLDPKFVIQVRAYVLGAITSLLPTEKVAKFNWPELQEITLADPEYHTPNKIDVLLGADVYGQVIREGLIKGPKGIPTAQNTALGWILSGPTLSKNDDHFGSHHCHHVVTKLSTEIDENELLKRFWQIESDSSESKILTEEEELCEQFYSQTTQRDATGRYIVRLPFREDNPQCKRGHSREIAVKRFHFLEKRFNKDPELKSKYSGVINEYLDLGHMECIQNDDDSNRSEAVYLPHHAVIRPDRSTTKVRVVFDGSCKGTNGISLNDTLMIGPRLQQDLRHIIMRWRMHPICLSADIVKMYRQIIVAKQDTDFQRLVWREDPGSEIKDYRLVRVTFGTASAPYLAIKTLQQLAHDEGENYSLVAERVKTDFYVDDLMTGCQTVEEGKQIKKEMKELLTRGGFDLQKWKTNSKELAEDIMEATQEGKVDIKMDEVVKVLGLFWHIETDSFQYSVKLPIHQAPITKRKVISDISRLFDALGWAAPCVVTAKVMIQKLWLSGIDWDEELPPELLKEWLDYREELIETRNFRVPRWVDVRVDDACLELHGFCDASSTAYAAVIYIRTIDKNGQVHTNLITAKTKVAPTMQVSIPRLELMGAVLLAKLMTEVSGVLSIKKFHIHGWTDSTVVLAWLSSHPSRWTTFVGNRTSNILSKMENSQWAHVQSTQNPADIASRGLKPSEISQNYMWLYGPPWLRDQEVEYTRPKSISTELEQRKVKVYFNTNSNEHQEDPIWIKYSSLHKLVRVVAFCRRFLKLKRNRMSNKTFEPYLTSDEISEALDVCIKQCQRNKFKDIRQSLKPLNPFYDQRGILRVGGRLQNANIPENTKHPIILPHSSHFTNLVIDEAHKNTLHGGPTLMLNYLRTRYWIISARGLIRKYLKKCVTCIRHAAATKTQLMGQLPASRVTPARPFFNSGVDFAGPINIRVSKGRGNRSYKGYICLFVCMATKAIHLEVVSDLTAQGFIAGFKRFVARRGQVSDLWSDNGTNFVGASKELRKLVSAENSSVAVEIREWLGNKNVTWHFIPPHAPNFGGLWEAGVKSTKFHLKRVIGDSTLTYEEISTVLTQVEACLNSRPLSILPNNNENPSPLTPGHFLVGEPLVVVPERNYEQSNMSSLKRWQMTQRIVQNFWRRWSNEYMIHCLQRYKWSQLLPEPNIGDVVLVKEDNLPPARWLLGKVVEKHPGLDKVSRVVTLKCKGSLIKRPTSKLCILPVTE